jgi:phosphoribosyl-ATP pyrophosphohydrolase
VDRSGYVYQIKRQRRPEVFDKILEYAAELPSGVLDPKAADKLVAERDELVDALSAGDYEGALTEGADAAYYVAKHLHFVAHRLGVSIADLVALAEAKYALRAQPGNPKDDAAERAACVGVLGIGPVEVARRSANSPREFAEKVAKL